ncbi:hypothetical protein [Bacillus sp. P14.5]|uniref:hypothetical protein n=1 Tax=Bacillus sp. P14.5 TaxID=1983400 RepID=UPI0013B06ADB|nr:hypothetical protein [Bacillus sp. P14.5]
MIVFLVEICIQKERVDTRVVAFEERYVSRRESGYMSDGFRGEICIQKKRVDT